MYNLIYVFLSFISLITANDDYISIKFDKRDTYRLQIEVDEWKGIYENYSPLTLQGDGNYFINYQKCERDIIEKDTFTFRGETIGRTLVNKEMKIEEDIHTKLLFYFIPTYASPFGLSLSLGLKNESSSILHTLYKEKKISDLKFGFYFPPSTPLNGTLYIGGVDKNLIKNMQSSQCRSNDTFWGCQLHKVTFNNNGSLVFGNTFATFFQTEYHPIYCPIEFLDYLKENFLKDLFENNVCKYHVFGSSKYIQIRCQNLTTVYSALPEYLNFDFGGNLLRIPMLNLTYSFTEIGKDYVVINMFYAERDVRNDQWNFGMNFFINYITLFDYEDKTVTFYSNENIITSAIISKESIQYFAITTIAILFLGCVLLIVIIYNMNK